MGFYTSLIFYRPRPAPLVNGPSLAAFVRRFFELDVAQSRCALTQQFACGERIDQDDSPLDVTEPTEVEGIYISREREWDVNEDAHPRDELPKLLDSLDQNMYRAYCSLGSSVRSIREQLGRIDSPENDEDFVPDSWSFMIGPITSGEDGEFMIAWMALSLSGNGYLYPWTMRDVLQRIERIPAMQRVMSLCRETWPVEPEKPAKRIIEARKAMGKYWPYERADLPWDWFWGYQGI
jgi:hypothetical protein